MVSQIFFFVDINLLFLFCAGALDRIYADCRLGLLVCCFVVHVQNDKILNRLNWIGNEGWEW